MVTNLELEQAGFNQTQMEHFWAHRGQIRVYNQFFNADKQGLKNAIANAIIDLDNIINKITWTNQEAIDAIKKEAQILKHIISFMKNEAL